MANAIIRPQAMRLNSKKIATLTGSTTDFTTNDQRQKGIDGVLGHSDGIADLDFEVKRIETFGDTGLDQIIDIIVNKQYCEVEGTIGSRIAVVTCRVVTASWSSDVESGKIEGTIKFESSGEPRFL